MLITKQPKKSNHNIRYEIYPPPQANPKIVASKLKNNKRLKEKLSKNLSQIPIEFSNDRKQNTSLLNIIPNRPYSSLVASDVSPTPSKDKIQHSLKKKKFTKKISTKKTTIGIENMQERQKVNDLRKRRLSGTSHNPRNNRSVDDETSLLKGRLAENRKRFNLSCCEMADSRDKSKTNKFLNKKKGSQKLILKNKKQSKPMKKKEKSPDKQKLKAKKVSMKGIPGFKSKGSTVGIGKQKGKKKQKKGKKGKKQVKYFVFSKKSSESNNEYPTNKYLKFNHKEEIIGHSSINYKSSLDIFSGSSNDIIKSDYSQNNELVTKKQLFLDSYEIHEPQEINFKQIRFYEEHSPMKKKKKKYSKFRMHIEEEILEDFPQLNSEELHFLTSVTLIQRKWRQYVLKNRFRKKTQKKEFDAKETTLKQTRLNSLIINQPQDTSISYGQVYNMSPESKELNEKISAREDRKEQIKESGRQEKRSYYKMFEKQTFPQITYIEYRQNLMRENYQKKMKEIQEEFQKSIISKLEFEVKKCEVQNTFNKQRDNLKRDKRDIKKGYLKYIDSFNKTKELSSKNSTLEKYNYGIRKVSSEDGFISTLYERIYKFDKCISEASDQSESIELLAKKMLVRKQFFQSNSISLTNRSKESLNQFIEKEGKECEVFSQSIGTDEKLDIKMHSRSLQLVENKKKNEEQLEKLCVLIEKQLIINLTIQLETEISLIDSHILPLILIQHKTSQPHHEHFNLELNQSPAYKALHEEFESLNSPTNVQIPISPASERKVLVDSSDIMFYLRELIFHIKEWGWSQQIVINMNENQGFTPFLYMKFLREYDIPDEEYSPIISNERFVTWQSYYIDTFEPEKQEMSNRSQRQVVRQCKTIFHRCIFEVFLSELEKRRPYGQKGKPMPWESSYSALYQRQLQKEDINRIFEKSLFEIEDVIEYKCGVIIEKHFYCNKEELERIHEDNEDRIIEMLEQDLKESPHQWYELQEHQLQIRLDLCFSIDTLIMEQFAKELTQLNLTSKQTN